MLRSHRARSGGPKCASTYRVSCHTACLPKPGKVFNWGNKYGAADLLIVSDGYKVNGPVEGRRFLISLWRLRFFRLGFEPFMPTVGFVLVPRRLGTGEELFSQCRLLVILRGFEFGAQPM
jgi:hypothetical protein